MLGVARGASTGQWEWWYRREEDAIGIGIMGCRRQGKVRLQQRYISSFWGPYETRGNVFSHAYVGIITYVQLLYVCSIMVSPSISSGAVSCRTAPGNVVVRPLL